MRNLVPAFVTVVSYVVVSCIMVFANTGCEGDMMADLTPEANEPILEAANMNTPADTSQPPTDEQQEQDETDLKKVAIANNQFACDLYGQLRQTPGNLFFSPSSMSTALSMALAAARSNTAQQMRDVLHLELPDERLHAAYAELGSKLSSDQQGLELRVANRLWGQTGYEFLPEFLAITRDHYHAELGLVDYMQQTEAARQEINRWVEAQTNNRIKDLLPSGSLNDRTRLVLTNAIYFKGDWAKKFDANSTSDRAFHVSADEEVTVPFMSQDNRFRYGKTDKLALLEMPYKGAKCSMWILLPAEKDALNDLEAELSEANLNSWMNATAEKPVTVQLPKFSLNSEFSMNQVLTNLGMVDAFDEDLADFSGMTEQEKLYITAVVHKAFVDVNEKGTEAAAATGIAFGATSVRLDPIIFRADHPFLYLIRDNETGAILFLGRVTNPS
ncbi:MAG: serpin family protein [Pirellulales bacterium]|nr:serpin family protein [Pirellulales bacterium]